MLGATSRTSLGRLSTESCVGLVAAATSAQPYAGLMHFPNRCPRSCWEGSQLSLLAAS